jgi:hypothetical protein
MGLEPIEHETFGQAASELPQPSQQRSIIRGLAHPKGTSALYMNLDVVTFF